VARPIGGLVFGHFGDRIGRKNILILSLLIMGIATALIGVLPTFQSIGIWAPVLLVVFRFCQGIGVGGEWGGAVLMAVEHAPEGRRGFYGSWPQMGVPAGLLLGNLVFFASRAVPPAGLDWRTPFLLSLLLVAVGLFIRLRILESPVFTEAEESGTEAQMPILDVVRTYPKNVLLAMGMRVAENGPFHILTVFVLSYVTAELGLGENVGLVGVLIAAAIGLITVPLLGTRVRYSVASIGYQLASVFAGGLAFPISEYLSANYGYQSIAIYMALMALITVISVLLASETYRGSIRETQS